MYEFLIYCMVNQFLFTVTVVLVLSRIEGNCLSLAAESLRIETCIID
jgi:hypothetical protein